MTMGGGGGSPHPSRCEVERKAAEAPPDGRKMIVFPRSATDTAASSSDTRGANRPALILPGSTSPRGSMSPRRTCHGSRLRAVWHGVRSAVPHGQSRRRRRSSRFTVVPLILPTLLLLPLLPLLSLHASRLMGGFLPSALTAATARPGGPRGEVAMGRREEEEGG
ncbi:unnamed protein product [Lampetra fluviatilis]